MLLGRLKRHNLADRMKEGREYRYFMNEGGHNRLAYYGKIHEDTRQQRKREQGGEFQA